MTKRPPATREELIDDWYRRARESQFAHYEAAKPLGRANIRLGVPSVVLSAIVATSVFASLEAETSDGLRILVGSISVIAAVLSALQTFLRFSERAEKHRSTGGRYGAIRRQIEQLRSQGQPYDDESIDGIRQQFDAISEEAPEISARTWKKVEAALALRSEDSS